MILSDTELTRYARQIILKEIGGSGQAQLKRASVTIIGCGGIGSPAIQYLAAAGIGRLTLVDDDHVDLSNLQRQTLYATADLGTSKVDAARAAIQRINPDTHIVTHRTRITPDNAASLIEGADVVLDGCDNFETRLAVADGALASRIPLVSAAAGQFDGQLSVYRGWEPTLPCYRCLVGDVSDQAGATCADDGVLGPVTGTLGSLAALEVIRQVVPFGDSLAGRLLVADLLHMRFRTIALPKDPACPACSG